ncbi:MAG: hypothetical protein H6600_00750 [Flavobacteriales bacterium]|nr:hypothetical protein [Flavobacteriales bacterium]
MYRSFVFYILILFHFVSYGQNEVVPIGNEWSSSFEAKLYEKQLTNFHTGVKPFIIKDISSIIPDSFLLSIKRIEKANTFTSSIIPLIEGSLKYTSDNDLIPNYGGGILVTSNFKKLGFTGFYRYGQFAQFPYQDSSLFMRESVNGLGLNQGNNLVHHNEFYLNYAPNEYFDLTLGNGKNFWGDGYRSLMLSDNASPYPFLRIMSSFWNVRYTNLYSMHVDNYTNGFQRKFITSHQLSWNITKTLNFSLYESVIFSNKDTLNTRGFDVNYLNPIIFYRPVEYAQGSSDNVLFGGSLKYTFMDKYVFYTQLILDEFLLSAYRDNNGWWANKFAIQFGFKTFDLFNIKDLRYQAEYNFARPFTYSHKYSILNYGHLGQSLGHPLGANFYELIQIIQYQKKKWSFRYEMMYQDRGENFNSINYGGDIFLSYLNRPDDYGNFIGQGERHFIWWNELKISYNILPKFNLRAFVDYTLRNERFNGEGHLLQLVQIGISSSFWNSYNDY